MATAKKPKGRRPLYDVVSDDLADSYWMLKASGGIPQEQAEQRLGSAALIHELTDRGLAHNVPPTPTAPASLQPASLDMALLSALAGIVGSLTADHDMLMTCLEQLRDVLPSPSGGCDEDPRMRSGSSPTGK
jgi:hypothetical protein